MKWCLPLLLICTSCVWPMAHDKGTKPYPIAVPVTYATTKSPPDHAATPGPPDKNLKIQKVTLAWTQTGPTNAICCYKMYQGPASNTYTNGILTFATDAVAYVWPGKTYYFSLILISTITDTNGNSLIVHCEDPYELVYTVPNKGGGPK